MIGASEIERLRSWTRDVATTLLPEGVRTKREGRWVRFLGQGGLLISDDGQWICHSARKGGHSTLQLIAFMGKYSEAQAETWAVAMVA